AGRPRRQQNGAPCTDRVVLGDPSARSLAYLARSHGIQLLRAHATDGATNTMIRETRDTAPPGARLRSRRCAYGCRLFPPCDVLFRSLTAVGRPAPDHDAGVRKPEMRSDRRPS